MTNLKLKRILLTTRQYWYNMKAYTYMWSDAFDPDLWYANAFLFLVMVTLTLSQEP